MIENSNKMVELIRDTVMDVCRLSLASENRYTVDGLIGVTICANKEVILIKFSNTVVNSTGIDHSDDSQPDSIPEYGNENSPKGFSVIKKEDENSDRSPFESFVSGPKMQKVERSRIQRLIFDTVMNLCTGTIKHSNFQVDGLIGITMAYNEVFLIKFDQNIKTNSSSTSSLDISSIARASGIIPEENNNDTALNSEAIENEQNEDIDVKPNLQNLVSDNYHSVQQNVHSPMIELIEPSINDSNDQQMHHQQQHVTQHIQTTFSQQPGILISNNEQHPMMMHHVPYPGADINMLAPHHNWTAQHDKTYTELKSPKEELMQGHYQEHIPISPVTTPEHDLTRKKRSFECMHCSKLFTCRALLENHIRTHTGEKPFTCEFCNKSFKEKSHLRRHRWTHDNSRPHNCQSCNKGFITKGEYRNHMKRYHEIEIP